MVTLGNYNPYQDLDSWYGVPDYGGAYNSYMGVQQQQLPLSRLISMVQEIQNGMGRRPMGNGAMSVSMPTTAQIPAQIANSLMSQQQRLLSTPRQRWAQSLYQPDVGMITPPPATGPGGGSASPGGLPTQVTYGGGSFPKAGAGSGGFANTGASASRPPVAQNPVVQKTTPSAYSGPNPYGSSLAKQWKPATSGGGFGGGGGSFR